MNNSKLLFLAVALVVVCMTTNVFAAGTYENPIGMVFGQGNQLGIVTSNENSEGSAFDVGTDRLAGGSTSEGIVASVMCNFIPNACDEGRDLNEDRLARALTPAQPVRNHECNFIPNACDHLRDVKETEERS